MILSVGHTVFGNSNATGTSSFTAAGLVKIASSTFVIGIVVTRLLGTSVLRIRNLFLTACIDLSRLGIQYRIETPTNVKVDIIPKRQIRRYVTRILKLYLQMPGSLSSLPIPSSGLWTHAFITPTVSDETPYTRI